MKGPISKHFNPIETATHRTPSKYRRIAVELAKIIPVSDVAYLFNVSSTTIHDWTEKEDDTLSMKELSLRFEKGVYDKNKNQ